ncbi:hypothetical protein Q0O91_13880, partial [Staphylococcus aureus]|nr:hypothetical protein [Staphylococcus aureus]
MRENLSSNELKLNINPDSDTLTNESTVSEYVEDSKTVENEALNETDKRVDEVVNNFKSEKKTIYEHSNFDTT